MALLQLRGDGTSWYYTGTPLTGWQQIDDNQSTITIIVGENWYQLHGDGSVWQYAGDPTNPMNWQPLAANNVGVMRAVSAGDPDHVYTLRGDGVIWHATTGGFVGIDPNPSPATIAIATSITQLYKLHGDGSIWHYTGRSWQQLDNNPATRSIVASISDDLFQLHNDGTVWKYTGDPTNWLLLDTNPSTRAIYGF